MIITAQSPCRVDLAGGTLDIWPLYLNHDGAVTVNFAVDRYTSCTLTTRKDKKIILRSRDQQAEESFASYDELFRAKKFKLSLLAQAVRFFAPTTGIELETNSEAPAGAGISGSSSLLITLSGALNKLTGRGYSIEKIREVAQNIEAQIIQVPTGCQDYYPAMYGGVSAIELGVDGYKRHALGADPQELKAHSVLIYTGKPRNSGINNWKVTKDYIDGDKQVRRNFAKITSIAIGMRQSMEKSNWKEAGRLLREEWSFRRTNAPEISTPLIDELATVSRKAGAMGCKVCGAGGGGCVFFLVEDGRRDRVAAALAGVSRQVQILDFSVAPRGLTVRVKN
jgi:D-glycero-alpha-D-manno-heptose-7-phosphate kinase